MDWQTLRRDILTRLFFCFGTRALAIAALGVGTVSAAMRVMGRTDVRPLLAAGAAAAAMSLFAALVAARRRVPSAERLRAFIDDRAAMGGLLTASSEVTLGAWASRIPERTDVTARFRSGRAITFLTASAIYLCAALVVPVRSPEGSRGVLDVTATAEALKADVETLRSAEVLEERRAEQMLAALDPTEDARADDPAKAYELLDRVQHEIDSMVAQSSEALAREGETLTQAEALTEALQGPGTGASAAEGALGASPGAAKRADAGTMAGALSNLTKELGIPTPGGSATAGAESASQALSPADLAKLASALAARRAKLGTCVKTLETRGLIDPGAARACKGGSGRQPPRGYLPTSHRARMRRVRARSSPRGARATRARAASPGARAPHRSPGRRIPMPAVPTSRRGSCLRRSSGISRTR
ncbi:MAG: hypothetical protein U0166_06295 [Acidobacteriota bacterium]